MSDGARRRWESGLVVAFGLLVAVGLWRHEIWRDEAQAWLLAKDSDSIGALFYNSRYEGHPLLWHVCLFGLAKVSHSLRLMQGFNWVIAIATAILVIKKSPFSLLQRGLIIFGYFSVYEYAVISRSYGLGVFLVFLFCTLYCQNRPSYWGLTGVLVLMANTSIFGLVVSGSLAIALFHRLLLGSDRGWFSVRGNFSNKRLRQRRLKQTALERAAAPSRWINYFCALLVGWVISIYQIVRVIGAEAIAVDHSAQSVVVVAAAGEGNSDGLVNGLTDGLSKLFQIVLKSYLPLPNFGFHFWNGHLLDDLPQLPQVGIAFLFLSGLLVVLSLVFAFFLLKKTPIFLWAYGFGLTSMVGLFALVHRGSTRHYGHLFILLLACLWLSRWRAAPDGDKETFERSETVGKERGYYQLCNQILTGVLCLHVLSGAYAYVADVRSPFSAGYKIAKMVETSDPSLPLWGLHQRPLSTVSAYLDRPIYYPEASQLGSFWDVSYPNWTTLNRVGRSLDQFAERHPVFLAVLTPPFEKRIMSANLTVTVTAQGCTGPAIVKTEVFCLYKVERNP